MQKTVMLVLAVTAIVAATVIATVIVTVEDDVEVEEEVDEAVEEAEVGAEAATLTATTAEVSVEVIAEVSVLVDEAIVTVTPAIAIAVILVCFSNDQSTQLLKEDDIVPLNEMILTLLNILDACTDIYIRE
jgi:hypothetical protein